MLLAPLTVVQPCLASGLVLLLWLGATRLGERPGRREFVAVAAIVLGRRRRRPGGARADDRPRRYRGDRPRPRSSSRSRSRSCRTCCERQAGRVGSAGWSGTLISAGCRLRLDGDRQQAAHRRAGRWGAAGRDRLAGHGGASEGLALLSEMSALQHRAATHVAPTMFAVQVLVPVLLAPLIFGESWGSTPLGGAVLVASMALAVVRDDVAGRIARRRAADDRVRSRRRRLDPVRSLLALRRSSWPPVRPTRSDASKFAIGFDHRDRGAAFRALDRGARLRAVVGGPQAGGIRGALGGVERTAQPRPLELGGRRPGGARVRRRCAVRPCSALRTPSWRRRWRRSGAGAEVEFVDCNREDLCMSFEDFERRPSGTSRRRRSSSTSAATSPSTPERIAAYCREHGIFLLEDCAHAHGADWNGRKPGAFGDAGVYSLYATKTVSTGEGGVLVSANEELIEFAAQVPQLRQVRARGRRAQLPDERVHRRPRPGPGRAHGGDRRLEERVRPGAPRPAPPGAGSSCPRG